MLAWLVVHPHDLDRLIRLFDIPPPQSTDRTEILFMDGPVYHSTRTMVEAKRTYYMNRGSKVYKAFQQDAEGRWIYQLVT